MYVCMYFLEESYLIRYKLYVYVCISVYVYVCIYVYIYVVCIYVYVCMYVLIQASMNSAAIRDLS